MKIVKEFSYSDNTITYKVFDGATQLNIFAVNEVAFGALFKTMYKMTDKFCWTGLDGNVINTLFDILNGTENALVVDLTLTEDGANMNKSIDDIVNELDLTLTAFLAKNKFNILLKNNCIQEIDF